MAPVSRALLAAAAVVAAVVRPARAVCGAREGSVVEISDEVAIAVCSERVVRVVRSRRGERARDVLEERSSLVIAPGYAEAARGPHVDVFAPRDARGGKIVQTAALRVVADEAGRLRFERPNGEILASERDASVGDAAVSQSWALDEDESIYGLGQYVNGEVDYRAAPIRMIQTNTEAVVPFFLSSRGYGVLWDNYAATELNPPEHELVVRNGTARFRPPVDGEYWFSVQSCEGFGCPDRQMRITLAASGVAMLSCEHTLRNLPNAVSCRFAPLSSAVEYEVRLDDSLTGPDVRVQYTAIAGYDRTTLASERGGLIDYYFMASDASQTSLDSVIAGYRQATGAAPLFGRWAYGFWQCKEHYHTQRELLEAAQKFRALRIPVDNFVQDWHYWGDLGWGPQWDPKVYPDPAAMVQILHGENVQLMVSVWSRFDEQTRFHRDLAARGLLIENSTYMDPWAPEARRLFFDYVQEAHFGIGVDALWLDATEPEGSDQVGRQVFLGSGDDVRNTYSLMVSKAVAEGLTRTRPAQRVFSLTRSAFAGQQRFGAALWSGDTTGSWDSLRRQIAMSINYQLSGVPVWSMDTGGFFRPADQYTSPDYLHLLTRWFQFAVFTPLFRVHGCASDTELWNYGAATQDLIVASAIDLRYRLLDYIYSGFARVESEHYTMQRGLVLDFPGDPAARRIADQFMFGPALMVAPLYTATDARKLYLPPLREGRWRNFHTGRPASPGWHSLDSVPRDRIPVFARSSVLVLGPRVQHAFQQFADAQLEVRVFSGCDARFDLFEDDGRTPGSASCTTPFQWQEHRGVLVVGPRRCPRGVFPTLPQTRTLRVVLVRPGVGVGVGVTPKPDLSAPFDGAQLELDLAEAVSAKTATVSARSMSSTMTARSMSPSKAMAMTPKVQT